MIRFGIVGPASGQRGLRALLDFVLVSVSTILAVLMTGGRDVGAGFLGAVIGMAAAEILWRARAQRRLAARLHYG